MPAASHIRTGTDEGSRDPRSLPHQFWRSALSARRSQSLMTTPNTLIRLGEFARMKHQILASAVAGALSLGIASTQAADIELVEWLIHLDGFTYGNLYGGDALSSIPGINDVGFDEATGLGTLTIDVTGAGSHTVLGFFDHQIDADANTYYNELGEVAGMLAPGQSWEIDEPLGPMFGGFGDIYDNVIAGTLDNTNAINSMAFPVGDDVSMATGYDFTLLAGEIATITWILSSTEPASGFYLHQYDVDSFPGDPDADIYLSTANEIEGGSAPIPASALLLLAGLAAAAAGRRRV